MELASCHDSLNFEMAPVFKKKNVYASRKIPRDSYYCGRTEI